MAGWGSSALTTPSVGGDNDIALPSPPSDTISCLAFSPLGNLVVAGCWDNGVRCWELQRSTGATSGPVTNGIAKAEIKYDAPVLATAFSSDPSGSLVFSGGADKVVKMWSLAEAGSQPQNIGQHEAPIRHMQFIPEMNLLATGGWDSKVHFWDARQPNPTHTIALPERCYALHICGPIMVVGTAGCNVLVYNLGSGCTLESSSESTLKHQTRCISIFPDKTGYAIGSIEGRVAIEYFDELPGPQGQPRQPPPTKKKGFAFKCHRDTDQVKGAANVFAVNSIVFHPYGTFATAGSDGTFNFWDKDSRQRLKSFPKLPAPVTCSCFNSAGDLFGYACGYDWSKGSEYATPGTQGNILIHNVVAEEIRTDVLRDSDGVLWLPNQVGGDKRPTRHLLQRGKNVLKPIQADGRGEKEVAMYVSLMMASSEDDLAFLKENGFCVEYFGIAHVQLDGLHSNPTPCLSLSNVTEGYKWPCVMDVKIGQKTYDSDASKAKRLYEFQKYTHMHLIGFRFVGMLLRHKGNISEPKVVGKDWGKTLGLQDAASGFVKFFHDGSTTGFRHDELLALISRISDLMEWFEVQTCARFISSSLLIVYDACEDDRPCGAAKLTVKMIDFAHTYLHNKAMDQNRDEEYLYGLKNIYTSLKELSALDLLGAEEQVAARLRDRKLWCQPA